MRENFVVFSDKNDGYPCFSDSADFDKSVFSQNKGLFIVDSSYPEYQNVKFFSDSFPVGDFKSGGGYPIPSKIVGDLILGAFADSKSLAKIIIPKSVKFIGKNAFSNTKLSSVEIASDCVYGEESFPESCNIQIYLCISIKYKILISSVRSANNYVQLSEINFYDSDSKKIYLTGADISANTNGNPLSYPNNTETEINLTDNNPETKLCALWQNNNLTILLTTDTEISFFSYTTANDEPNRDPVSWQIYKSVDNGLNWELIQTVTNAEITSSRKTETQLFPL